MEHIHQQEKAAGAHAVVLVVVARGPSRLHRRGRPEVLVQGLGGLVEADQGPVRVLGLLYLSVLRAWLKDETEDMAATMKALDSRLAQVEQLANTLQRGGRRRRGEASEEGSDDASAESE